MNCLLNTFCSAYSGLEFDSKIAVFIFSNEHNKDEGSWRCTVI